MAKKCARTFSIVVEKGKKSILDVGHLLPVGRACRSLSLGRRHGVNQSLAPKQVETAGACRGDRQKMAVWNSSARGWRPLRGHHPS